MTGFVLFSHKFDSTPSTSSGEHYAASMLVGIHHSYPRSPFPLLVRPGIYPWSIFLQANGELDARFSEHSKLLDRSVRAMDSRALGLHTSAERICSFFANIAMELEDHETREAAIDDAAEVRVSKCLDIFSIANTVSKMECTVFAVVSLGIRIRVPL